jgi:hypothetical protein
MQNIPQITHILVDSLQTAVSDPGVLPELKPQMSITTALGTFVAYATTALVLYVSNSFDLSHGLFLSSAFSALSF